MCACSLCKQHVELAGFVFMLCFHTSHVLTKPDAQGRTRTIATEMYSAEAITFTVWGR